MSAILSPCLTGTARDSPYIEEEGICLIQVPDGVNFGSGKEAANRDYPFCGGTEGKTIGSFAGHRFFLLGYRKRDGIERCQRSAGSPKYSPKQLIGTNRI